jgi:hypothetical protein
VSDQPARAATGNHPNTGTTAPYTTRANTPPILPTSRETAGHKPCDEIWHEHGLGSTVDKRIIGRGARPGMSAVT